MRPNRLRELLKAGAPSVGTHVMTTSPDIVEMIGKTGLIDYIEFVRSMLPTRWWSSTISGGRWNWAVCPG